MTSRLRVIVVLGALVTAAACGQKAGVSESAAGGRPPGVLSGPGPGAGGASGSTGAGAPGAAGTGDAAPSAPAVGATGAATPGAAPGVRPGATVPTPPAAGARLGATAATTRAGTPPPGGAAASPASPGAGPGAAPPVSPAAADDRTGVTDTEIVIGVHAPITGAAPVPQDSLERAKGLYWRFVAERGGVHGRNVRVIIKDDQFNPSRAVQVCREMVEQDKVFLLMGIGTDQVIPCARYASQVGVPYFATGGGEAGLDRLSTYFNVSMTFPQQAPMVAQVVKRAGKAKVGIVVTNTPNYSDTLSSLEAAARQAGLQVVRTSRMSKNASQSEALAEANALRTSGAEAVMLMLSPLVFLNLAHAAQGQAYSPLWAGPGLSNGLNLVAEFGCPSIAGARFLSPFPQLDVIDRFDPDYRAMYRKVNGEEADDLGLAMWGLDKTLKQFFDATGRDLSRPRLLATITSGREFASSVLPPVRYTPENHFGAAQAHLLEADCQNRRYRTVASFVSEL